MILKLKIRKFLFAPIVLLLCPACEPLHPTDDMSIFHTVAHVECPNVRPIEEINSALFEAMGEKNTDVLNGDLLGETSGHATSYSWDWLEITVYELSNEPLNHVVFSTPNEGGQFKEEKVKGMLQTLVYEFDCSSSSDGRFG